MVGVGVWSFARAMTLQCCQWNSVSPVEHQGSSWASDTHSVTQKLQFIDVTVWVLIEGRILTARVLIEAGVQALWTWLEAM